MFRWTRLAIPQAVVSWIGVIKVLRGKTLMYRTLMLSLPALESPNISSMSSVAYPQRGIC